MWHAMGLNSQTTSLARGNEQSRAGRAAVASNQSRPWLTYDGVRRPDSQIRSLALQWNSETWAAYLEWLETSRRESILPPHMYDDLCEEQIQSIFEQFDHELTQANQDRCESLLSELAPRAATVLRHIFFEGQTDRQIAAHLNMTGAGVHQIKARALSRLKKRHHGESVSTRRFMRGACDSVVAIGETISARASSSQLKEARVYDPAAQIKEFKNIEHSALRAALVELSETQRRVIYLHFWCDFTLSEIARDLRCGVNLAEQVLEAAVSRLKRRIVENESLSVSSGGPSCA